MLQIRNCCARIAGIGSPSAAPMPILARHWPVSEMSITCLAATLLAILLLPLLILLWATESREQRARRWRRDGWTQQRIADRLGCSRTTVRRLLAA
jgi:AraC-like DNA-binding protein